MTTKNDLTSLVDIMNRLRVECPWDNKQTFDSLKSNTIEECYELIEAIGNRDFDNIKEELGDMLLQIVFYSKLAQEEQAFTIDDVIEGINSKLIRRHPHVFGTTEVSGSGEVSKNWEEIKRREKGDAKRLTLAGVPTALPPLIKAYRMQKKAASVGFDWDNLADCWDKFREEITEFEDEVKAGNKEKMEQEMGDIIFSLINCARKYNIDPSDALERTNKKFLRRFNYIEEHADYKLSELTLEQMEELWVKAKQEE